MSTLATLTTRLGQILDEPSLHNAHTKHTVQSQFLQLEALQKREELFTVRPH
jgi:hypothetical protein